MELLKIITEKEAFPGIKSAEGARNKFRRAARAVLFDAENKVGLLHVSNRNYYKLPGGGIETSESAEDALKRECLEEIGCNVIVKGEVGRIVEHKDKWGIEQESLCYIAEVLGEKGESKLEKDEKEDGFKPVWVNLDQAIRLVENSKPAQTYDGHFIKIRDAIFLRKAKEIKK